MELTIETITPHRANELLEHNIGNRPVSQRHIEFLAQEMAMGRWKLNGDTICFDEKGRLIDGQHRLAAVIKSGVTIDGIIVRSVKSSVFDTKDIGKRRSAADALAICGESNRHALAAALVLVDRYRTGQMSHRKNAYSNAKVIELLRDNPEIRRSIRIVGETKGLAPASALVAAHYFFSEKDTLAADVFMEDLIQGSNLDAADPVYRLRERLNANRSAKGKLHRDYIFGIVIKTWNFRRQNRVVKRISVAQSGAKTEQFPHAV